MARQQYRSWRRGSRVQVGKNSFMRVWVSFNVGAEFTAGVPQVFTLADPAGFATTSGNTKHIGTLVRVRADFGLEGTAGAFSGWGIRQVDVAESAAAINPLLASYGDDEDLLGRALFCHPTATVHWNDRIDIKAKRRWDVENVLVLDVMPAASLTGQCVGRALFLVP